MIIRKIERQVPIRKKRAAAYCRVSTSEQDESYETQYNVYKRMIDADDDLVFAGIYSDKGRSGTSYKHRPGFQQMIADAEERKFDVLYVKSISRFARNVGDCQRYVDLLREKDIVVHFEREHIRSDDPTSNFALALIGAVSQDESHSISKNVAMGYHERFSRGKFNLGSNRILGYDTNKEGKLVPNQDAWIIREIFERYVGGDTFHGITDLDNIPYAADFIKRHLTVMDYVFPAAAFPAIQIFTGRGCPAQCNFCVYPQTLHGHKYRLRSPENVIGEIEYIIKNFPDVKEIVFEDDTFTINKKRVTEICNLMLERKIKIRWLCNARVNLDYETMCLMKKAGCHLIIPGIESVNQQILNNIHKGTTVEQIEKYVENARKAGLMIHENNIRINLPSPPKA